MKKRLNDYRYTAAEANLIVSTQRQQLPEAYRDASAEIELYQATHAELTDEYLILLLQGQDPEGIMPEDRKKQATVPGTKGLTDGELETLWQGLEKGIKSMGEMYLAPDAVRSNERVITEAVAYVIRETVALRQQPANRPSVLMANFAIAETLVKRALTSLKSYLESGMYAIDIDAEHISEGGSNIFDTRFLSEADRAELLAIRDARARAKYDALAEHTRVPLPHEGTGLVDSGQRQCTFGQCEIRAVGGVSGQGKRRIEAFVPFNSPSAPLRGSNRGTFVEVLMAGCFSSALAEGNEIRALWNHDAKMPLGTTRNNTLEITQHDNGLAYTCFPNLRTTWGQDCYESIKRGDVHNTSFQFLVEGGGEEWPEGTKIGGHPVREIHRVALLTELSPCTFGAYESSKVIAKGDE